MRIYMKNVPVKFHLDPIWNDGALGLGGSRQQEQEEQEEQDESQYEISSWYKKN